MKCIYCGSEENKVLDSRNNDETIRRRRECLNCGRRFTTYEYIEKIPFLIVKKDGSRQSYDREKLLRGIKVATYKRSVSVDDIKEIADNIEKTVQNRMLQEVKSSTIGEMVLSALKDLDRVSYIRYASVYKNFQTAQDFIRFINEVE